VARLVLPIFTNSGHRSDCGHCQECEPGHFQPETVKDLSAGVGSGPNCGHDGPADAISLDCLDDRLERQSHFLQRVAVDHTGTLPPFAIGRFYQRRGVQLRWALSQWLVMSRQRSPTPGGFVDQQLKQLMKELGEAINESLSDSEQIAEVVARIKEGGYDIFLVLEATIGVSKQGEQTTDKTSLVSTLSTNSELKISDQDLKFLKSLRIKIDDNEEE